MKGQSAADQWTNAAAETKLMAEHDYRVGVSKVPFGHDNNPATHRYASWMRAAKDVGEGEVGR